MRPGPTSPWRAVPLLAVVVCFAWAGDLSAQDPRTPLSPSQPDAPPRVGLVLSGGSAKGFAHIGVLRVLEQVGLSPDVVSGTSMGSIVGGLYASGIGVDSLEHLARDLPWSDLIGDVRDRREAPPDERFRGGRTLLTVPLEGSRPTLPAGAVEGANIHALLARLTWRWAAVRDFTRLPVPFVAVATDLESGEPVPLTDGVFADALRASMSLPGAVNPVRMDGRLLVDGGLTRNLPAQDAVSLGADLLVCSDVSGPLAEADELESINTILMQVAAFRTVEFTLEQRKLCDVLIRPDIEGLSSMAFDEGAAWIERGEAAASQQIDTLRALARRIGARRVAGAAASAPPPSSPLQPTVEVGRIDVSGLENPDARRLVIQLVERLTRPADGSDRRIVDADILDRVLRELRATTLLENVRYRLDREDDAVVLTIAAAERRTDRVGIGVRYDDDYRASLLLEARLGGLAGYGSELLFTTRLGEELQLQADLVTGRGITTDLTLEGRAGWTRLPIDLRTGDDIVARLEADLIVARALVGFTPDDATLVALDVGGEWSRGSTEVAIQDTTDADFTGSAALVLLRDDRDDPALPTRGSFTRIRLEGGLGTVGPGGSFQHHRLETEHFLPLGPRLVVRAGGYLGYADGRDLPIQRFFFVGGVNTSQVLADVHPTFFGTSPQERLGTAVQIARAGLRWEFLSGRWLGLGVDAGGVGPGWRAASRAWTVGWALSLASSSPAGPARLTLHGDEAGSLSLAFSLGRRF